MLRTTKVARNVVVQRNKFWYKGLLHRSSFYLMFSMKPLRQTNKYFKPMRKEIWPIRNWFSITCMMYSNEQYRQITYKRNPGARSRKHCRGKVLSIIYSGCVYFAFFTQYEMRLLRTILLFVTCTNLQYFSTLSLRRHNFGKNLLDIKHVFRFSLKILSETFWFHFLSLYIWLYVLYVFV